jgi:two-component system, cell cycle response regulator
MAKKILVVEDNEQNRILMRQILKYQGYELLEAADGAAGLAMAREHMPDLILLDLQMPVMGGFAVIRELRKTPELSKLKVVAVTSFAMKGDREKALEAGFDEYVTKPIDTRKFIELVKNILPGETVTLKKPIILCVDDEPANLKLLENILVPRGYEVVSAASGEDALQKIKTRTIDLVLLDLMMPGMDGLQVSRKIKDNKKYGNVPVIMLTAYTGAETYIKTLSNEVFAYLQKPFEAEELIGIVKAALGQSVSSHSLPRS